MKRKLSIILTLVLGLFVIVGCAKKTVNEDLLKKYVEISNKFVETKNAEFLIDGELTMVNEKTKVEGEIGMDFNNKLAKMSINVGNNADKISFEGYADKDYSYFCDTFVSKKWIKQKADTFGTATEIKKTDLKEVKELFQNLDASYTDDSIIVDVNKNNISKIAKNFNLPSGSENIGAAMGDFKLKLTIKVKDDVIVYSLSFDAKIVTETMKGFVDFSLKPSTKKIEIPEEVKKKAVEEDLTSAIPGLTF